MSILQRIRQTLESRGLPSAGPDRHGYLLETVSDTLVIVRWGCGDPFRDVHRHQALRACHDALRRAGYHIRVVRFANPTGAYLQVTERP